MIHYQLQCSAGHGFDGWFRDSAGFDEQATLGLLECPVCGDTAVNRALMTPAVPKKGRAARKKDVLPAPVAATQPASAPALPPGERPVAVAGEGMPDHVRAMLQRLRSEVERNCDYVGHGFAEEARRMHYGEADRRSIYGETTSDEAESLADEGIEIARIPWVPRADG
jgi:hypothetical protein